MQRAIETSREELFSTLAYTLYSTRRMERGRGPRPSNQGRTGTFIITLLTLCKQVSKNIFNKNDNNVGLLRSVKKVWIQEEHSKQ